MPLRLCYHWLILFLKPTAASLSSQSGHCVCQRRAGFSSICYHGCTTLLCFSGLQHCCSASRQLGRWSQQGRIRFQCYMMCLYHSYLTRRSDCKFYQIKEKGFIYQLVQAVTSGRCPCPPKALEQKAVCGFFKVPLHCTHLYILWKLNAIQMYIRPLSYTRGMQ